VFFTQAYVLENLIVDCLVAMPWPGKLLISNVNCTSIRFQSLLRQKGQMKVYYEEMNTATKDLLDFDKVIALVAQGRKDILNLISDVETNGVDAVVLWDAKEMLCLENAACAISQAETLPLPSDNAEFQGLLAARQKLKDLLAQDFAGCQAAFVTVYISNAFWENLSENDIMCLKKCCGLFQVHAALGEPKNGQSQVLSLLKKLAENNIAEKTKDCKSFSDAKGSLDLLAVQCYKPLRDELKRFQPTQGEFEIALENAVNATETFIDKVVKNIAVNDPPGLQQCPVAIKAALPEQSAKYIQDAKACGKVINEEEVKALVASDSDNKAGLVALAEKCYEIRGLDEDFLTSMNVLYPLQKQFMAEMLNKELDELVKDWVLATESFLPLKQKYEPISKAATRWELTEIQWAISGEKSVDEEVAKLVEAVKKLKHCKSVAARLQPLLPNDDDRAKKFKEMSEATADEALQQASLSVYELMIIDVLANPGRHPDAKRSVTGVEMYAKTNFGLTRKSLPKSLGERIAAAEKLAKGAGDKEKADEVPQPMEEEGAAAAAAGAAKRKRGPASPSPAGAAAKKKSRR